MKQGFTIEALNSSHDRSSFDCGTAVLNTYLQERASQDVKRRLSNCFVALDNSRSIAAYYTLAATGLPLLELQEPERKRLPRYDLLPAVLIGRLAVSQTYQGKGLGGALIMDAASRAATTEIATYALVVDAKDDQAKAFYIHFGFMPFASRPMKLFLPLASLLKAKG